jgi:hypothetical protein
MCLTIFISKREILLDGSRDVGLEVNAEKTKYMLLSRHQNAEQSLVIKTANGTSKNMAQLILRTTVRNRNLIQEEIKVRLSSGNACYHSIRKLLSFRLLSENVKIKTCKAM